MTQRLQVVHTTKLSYDGKVAASFNEARMTPANTNGQLLLRHELHVSPSARLSRYVDYWGTAVVTFDVHLPHRALTVVSSSVVDTVSGWRSGPGVSWGALRREEICDRYCEYLQPSSYVDDASLDSRAELVEQMRSAATAGEATSLAIQGVRDRLRYHPGATGVRTTAGQAWAERIGVCQDFSHVSLSLLRAVGIPARYVSGYLHEEEAELGETGLGESHAWIEAWDGAWVAHDPTNDRRVGPGHVVVAHGRDYRDVSPLTGIYAGPLSGDPEVVVEVTRLPR
ncbi:MAG: transglutaminase family protein [Candidatus Nanopelagicales bacterium]